MAISIGRHSSHPVAIETFPVEKKPDLSPIETLPNEVLFKIFEYSAGSANLRTMATLFAIRSVCRQWRDGANASVLKLFWDQIAHLNLPSYHGPLRRVEARIRHTVFIKNYVDQIVETALYGSAESSEQPPAYSSNTFYFQRFEYLSEELHAMEIINKDFKKKIPEKQGSLILSPQLHIRIQKWLDTSLERVLKWHFPQFHFEQKKENFSAKQIRLWLNDPASQEQIKTIKKLYFSLPQLKSLPFLPEISQFTSITELTFTCNQLKNIPIAALAPLTYLTELSLSHNRIASFPDPSSSLASLTKLNLTSNKLATLPLSIGDLTSLKDLNLSDNALNNIPSAIGKLTSLASLNLSENKINDLPETVGNLISLDTLDLSHNQITSLSASIMALPLLTALKLSYNPLLFILQPNLSENEPFSAHSKKEATQEYRDKHATVSTYSCQTPFAALCQAIHRREPDRSVQRAFEKLSEPAQQQINAHIQKNEPLLSYKDRLAKALIATARAKLKSCDDGDKKNMLWRIWKLSGKEGEYNILWAHWHARDNILRLIDALEWATKPLQSLT